MPTRTVNGVEIYYETHGSGPPLLLVAGLGGVGSYWNAQIPAFSKRYTVILHDHRGTGRSGRPDQYSVELMAQDLVALMDDLGIESAHFVGHSTGGAIGQVIAIEHPARLASMVQYAAWTKADALFRWSFEVRKTLLSAAGVGAYTHATPIFLMPPWFIRDNDARLRAEEEKAVAGAPPAHIIEARIDAILRFDQCSNLLKIKTPTLVLCVKDDRLTPPYFSEDLARMIPGARLAWLEQGGHACSQVVPEEFNATVLSFVDAQQARAQLPVLE